MATEILYAVEPVEKKRSYKTVWYVNKYHNDEEFKKHQQQYLKEWMKNKYQNDEEYRQKFLASKREQYHRKKIEKALKSANSP